MESSKAISKKEYPDFLKEGAAKPRPLSKNRDILSQKCLKDYVRNKTRNFDEKRGNAALLIKIPGFIFNAKKRQKAHFRLASVANSRHTSEEQMGIKVD